MPAADDETDIVRDVYMIALEATLRELERQTIELQQSAHDLIESLATIKPGR